MEVDRVNVWKEDPKVMAKAKQKDSKEMGAPKGLKGAGKQTKGNPHTKELQKGDGKQSSKALNTLSTYAGSVSGQSYAPSNATTTAVRRVFADAVV